jgi:hypothetical protein
MARVALVRNGLVINVIEVDDINQIPDWAVIGFDEEGNPVRKADCDLHIETEIGSRDDLYEHRVGFYRQHDMDVQSIEQVAGSTDVEELL